MKLIIVLSVLACGYAAKLDRTYLPPANAATAGGNADSLSAPFGSPSASSSKTTFGQTQSGFGKPTAFDQDRPASAFGQDRPSGPSGFGQQSAAQRQPSAQYGAPSGPAPKQTGFGQDRPSGTSGFGQQSAAQRQQLSNQYGAPSAPAAKQSFGQGPSATFGQEGEAAYSQAPGFQGSQDYSRQQPERPQAAYEKNAEILRYENENDGEKFSYSFETSNGISAEESGVATNGVQAQGGFAYTGDDGEVYRVTYTADENGYQPQGDHLPTSPPIPDEILRSIEENARAAAAGTQEGAYRPEEYETENAVQQYNQPRGQASPAQYTAPNAPVEGPSAQYGAPEGQRQAFGTTAQRQGPTTQYGAPDAFQPQGPSAQYGAPNGAQPQRPSAQFGANAGQQQRVSSQYNTPSAQGPNFKATGGSRQGPSAEYGAPNAGQSQGPSTQYGAPEGQRQSFSSTQYSAPSKGQGQSAQFVAPAQSQGPSSKYGAPNAQFPSPLKAQGSQVSAQYNQQSSNGQQLSRGPQAQGGDNGYEYNRPQANAGFNQPRPSQGPSGPRPQFNQASQQVTQQYNRPAVQGQSTFPGSANQQAYRPSSPAQGPFGPSGAANKPSGPFGTTGSAPAAPSAPSSQYRGQSGPAMPAQAPYQYNKPGSQGNQSGQPQRPSSQSGFNQSGQPQRPSSQSNFNQSGQGQDFSGPRQPPSFSEQEGYKY